MEKTGASPSSGELIILNPRKSSCAHINAGLLVQLLSIRDNHPQWCALERETGVIAAHKYAAQLNFSAPHKNLTEL